ncbi:MAG: SDR family oxidoreductase [Chthoniobacteraceae bacterium]
MGRELYAAFPAFRTEVDRCAEILRPHLGLDIRDILWPKNRNWQKNSAAHGIDLKAMLAGNTQPPEDGDTLRLNQTEHLQPALFTIEYALARLWIALGVAPHAIVGHSMGEYVAACLAGVFSLDDALHLIVRRAQLVALLPPARMLAVTLSESELQPLLRGELSISLINGPSLCVVAGPPPAVEEFARTVTARGVMCRPVQNTHAFHSRLLDPIVPAFAAEVRKVRLSAPRIPFVSNVTGRWIATADATDPDYWARHANHTARFHDALHTLWQTDDPVLLEAGPGHTLSVLAQQHPSRPAATSSTAVASLRHHYETQPDEELLLMNAGRLWLCGVKIRWENLHSEKSRRKISLPTYPFERHIHWLEAAPSAPVASAAIHKNSNASEWFYVPSWKRMLTAPVSAGELSARLGEKRAWIFFTDECGVASKLLERFRTAGHEIITVRPGREFGMTGPQDFTIAPGIAENYERLLESLVASTTMLGGIVHAWSIGRDKSEMAAIDGFVHAQDLGFHSLLCLAKALAKQGRSEDLRLFALSDHVQDVHGREELRPEKSTLLGPCLVIPQEFPNIIVKSIDLELPENGRLDEQVVDHLAGEFCCADSELFVAHRNGQRWIQTYEPATLPQPDMTPPVFREGGAYLITGGLGNAGREIARYLARTFRAKLILIGRSSLPLRESWPDWIKDHPGDDPTARRIRSIEEIEALGGAVLYVNANVDDRAAMQSAIDQGERKFGTLHGVIHGAGVVGDEGYGEIQDADRAHCDLHFQSKARGLLVLNDLLAGRTLDCCLLMSSLASILGGIGQAAYSAANIYLDTFARLHSRESTLRWLSVNWDVWRTQENIWGHSGPGKTLEELGMTSDEAMHAMTMALAARHAGQLIVSTGKLDARIRQWVKLESLRSGKPPASGRASSAPGANGTSDAPSSANEFERFVANVWQSVLGIDDIGLDETFLDLGGHSLLMMQVVGRLRAQYRVELSLRDFLEASTIGGLAKLIGERLLAGLSPARQPPSLISIQRGDPSRMPLFLIPGGWGGEVEFVVYAGLSQHIDPGLPIWGLQARCVGTDEPAHSSVPEMAADYLSDIRRIHPHGPFMLAGECIGGICAYEMACQLERNRESVALVVLLDTIVPTESQLEDFLEEEAAQRRIETQSITLRQRIRHHREQMSGLTLMEKFTYILGRAFRRKSQGAPPANEHPRGQKDYPPTLLRHRLQAYGGTVTLLIDEESSQLHGVLGWETIPVARLETHVLPGTHLSYIRENAATTGALLRDLLRQAASNPHHAFAAA